ncbi:hypothetical protein MSG28_013744 [Choristoneura fumiferana]|uniref:Uncharacterized protein n=1 Tax=Choristoneura fumiferana TaxID=7141 RepID=A0ACC0K8P9_CHOFU|nr:hypothetical protein MSG28_013744 [Choristoneura fumiferana]
MSKSTICNAISEVCAAINEALQNYAKTPSTEEEWLSIAQEFNEKWNFPNCIGAVDGKHCVIQAPINSGSDFFNYKSTFSVVLMAIFPSSEEEWLAIAEEFEHHNLLGLCRPDFQVRGRLTIYKPEWGYSHGIFSLSVQEFPCQQVQQLSHAALKVLRSLGVAASFHLHLDVRQRLQGDHNLLGLCRPDFQVRGRLTIYKPEWGYSHGIFSLSVQEFPCQQVQQLSHAALKVLRSLGVAASFHLHLDVRQRLQGVTPIIAKQDTCMREAISPHERLSATLRFLITGGTYKDVMYSSLISRQSLGYIIPETCEGRFTSNEHRARTRTRAFFRNLLV